jgi:histidinol dehydrogenase
MIQHTVSIHDRGADQSSLVYDVISRRSGGLSLGINLFPEGKKCSFDCPYCEVKPPEARAGVSASAYSARALEAELEAFFTKDYAETWAPLPLRDICVSGNGEPTLSPHLLEALEICAAARRRHAAIVGTAPIVLITNATGFLNAGLSGRLAEFAAREPLKIWAKLDAGSQKYFAAISRSAFSVEEISKAMTAFARTTPIIIQTMLCELNGQVPNVDEALSFASRVNAMLAAGARIEAIQVYTLARMPSEPWVRPLSDEVIAKFINIVNGSLHKHVPVAGYGERGTDPLAQA